MFDQFQIFATLVCCHDAYLEEEEEDKVILSMIAAANFEPKYDCCGSS